MATWPKISLETDRGYRGCFGCGQDNPIGLKLNFQRDGKAARAEFNPSDDYQGWAGMVHGGIIICLLDEGMSWAVLFEGVHAVTAKMQVNLKRPASVNEPLVITSSITRKTRKVIETEARVALKDGTVIADATAKHFVVDSAKEEVKSIDRTQ